MADETTLGVGIKADVKGSADVKNFADDVASVGDALRGLASDAKNMVSQLDKVERGLATAGSSSKTATGNIRATTQALRDQATAAKSLSGSLANAATANARMGAAGVTGSYKASGPGGASPSNVGIVTAQQRESLNATNAARELALRLEREATAELTKQLKLRRDAVEAARAARLSTPQTGTGPGSAAAVAGRMGASGVFAAQDAAAAREAQQAYQNAKDALGTYNDNLANTRYAMYGFSNSIGIAGVALTAMSFGVLKVAADFETMYANIERTSGLTGASLSQLEGEFVELGQTIPASFADLGNIATLAGQLNIPANQIANFTETVAKFVATTDVSVDSATTAFGRLDALLPDVQGNYEALGSSILNVGVNSVATESEIISTTSQIAAAGAQAGFTADQVIGLASSFASLGVAPEASRGTTIRVFSEIGKAIAAGGEELDAFAQLAGQSGEEFEKAWGADAGSAFLDVLRGLQSEGGNAETVLRSLGITAVRDINALLRLSQNAEIVAENFGYAADGFSQATQLGSSFEIIAATLASKVQVLANSFQALMATLGGTGIGIIGSIVDGLSGMAQALTTIAQNPFAQTLVTAIGTLVALSGIVMIATSGFGHMVATLLAGRPVAALFTQTLDVMRTKLVAVKAEAALTGTSLTTMGAAAKVAGGAVKGALVSTGIGIGLIAVLTAVTAGWDAVAKATQSAGDYASESVGDFGGLTEALNKDTEAANGNFKGLQTIQGEIISTKTRQGEWVSVLEQATGAQIELSNATGVTTETVKPQTLAIAENTQAWLANMLASSDAAKGLVEALAGVNAGTEFSSKGFFGALIEGDIAEATRLRDVFAEVALARATITDSGPMITSEDQAVISALNNNIKLVEGSLAEAATQTAVTEAVMGNMADQSQVTGETLDMLSGEAGTAADAMSILGAEIEAAFSQQNTLAGFASDFYTLIGAIYEGGASFSAFDQAGQVNLANLQSSISSVIAAGQTMGISATESVGLLFAQLQKSGVDTATLLASLAGMQIKGVDVSAVGGYSSGATQFTAQANAMNSVMTQMADRAKKAAANVGGGGGGGGGLSGAAKKACGAAKKAAAEIRTLADYAGDLGKVFNRSFELRFSGGNGLDSITTGWRDIAEATAEANKKIDESRIKMQQLTADKSIQEYFLGIANAYGDNLRANDIAAQIAKINGDIADEAKSAADASGDASKELMGNSSAAIKNRASLQGLVKDYQGYIESLASSGMGQSELQAETMRLKAEFEAQAAALGFSTTQVQAYSASFLDMTAIIAKVPRNVTVTTNINNGPAFLALAEFEAQAKRSGDAAGAKAGAGAVGGIRSALGGLSLPPINLPPVIVPVKYQTPSYAQLMAMQATIRAQTGDPNFRIALGPGGQGGQTFATGGYTGGSSAKDIVGAVHGKEFVVDADNTSRLGLPFLNALNNGAMPTASQASATSGARNNTMMVVELSATDRSLLARAGDVKLKIGTKDIQQASSSANLVSAKRGTN